MNILCSKIWLIDKSNSTKIPRSHTYESSVIFKVLGPLCLFNYIVKTVPSYYVGIGYIIDHTHSAFDFKTVRY